MSARLVLEVSGPIFGARTPAGSCAPPSASRSLTNWRTRKISARSANVAVIALSPWMLSLRSAASWGVPLSADSIGRVTSSSTCSAESPGASVWMTTIGGANSGNTSSFVCAATKMP